MRGGELEVTRSDKSVGSVRAGFRSDVQGLRAVAVGLVLLDHAGLPFVSGGFVGVDVFFVISGFLISGQLLDRMRRTGRVDFAAFYASRARRLLPASIVVIIATAIAAVITVSPLRLGDILRDGIATALYVPNIYFAVEQTDYLAGAEPSPYQHFWSLGVEEQFYLFWPLLLLGVYLLARRSTARIAIALALVAVASFVACVLITPESQPFAFFSLPTRAWEFAVGALVALGASALARVPSGAARAATWVGLGAIGLSATVFSSATVFPGSAALLPVVGTALLIGFGGRGRANAGKLLSARPFQFIGAISYSLYLVHWPLLVLVGEELGAGGALPVWLGLILVVLSIPIAWVSYRVIETPFRSGTALPRLRRRRMLAGAAAASLLLSSALALGGSASALMPLTSGRSAPNVPLAAFPSGTPYVPDGIAPALVDAIGDTGDIYRNGCQQNLSRPEVTTCSYGDTGSATVVALFGDSHAGRWFPALERAAISLGFRLDTYTKSGCRSEETDAAWDDTDNASCSAWREGVLQALTTTPPDAVILANHLPPRPDLNPVTQKADWEQGITSSLDRLPATAEAIIIADSPQFASSPVQCLANNLDTADRCSAPRDSAFNETIREAQIVAANRSDAAVIDLNDYLCNAENCPAVIGSTLVYSDDHHLTATFAAALAPAMEETLAPYLEEAR